MDTRKVVATKAALALIETLRTQYGPIMFHQSGGCCDGSAPMCYFEEEFRIGESDILLGQIGNTKFYIGAAQYEYWRYTQIIVDVVPGRGGGFSLEAPEGVRFISRARGFTDEECMALEQVK